MRYFETRGPVNAEENYVVARLEETAAFLKRVALGRYIVLFAPRQTGKTTFFKTAAERLATDVAGAYLPINSILRFMKIGTVLNLSFTAFSTSGFAKSLRTFFASGNHTRVRPP